MFWLDALDDDLVAAEAAEAEEGHRRIFPVGGLDLSCKKESD